jgi:hypothetical protein
VNDPDPSDFLKARSGAAYSDKTGPAAVAVKRVNRVWTMT